MKNEFIVSDMTCEHCVRTITAAVQALDPQARVQADLATHRVTVASGLTADALAAAIRDEDYEVQIA